MCKHMYMHTRMHGAYCARVEAREVLRHGDLPDETCHVHLQGAGCRVQGAGCRVQGAGCRVHAMSTCRART